jgi:uncharacterized membrane protein YjgN (DUF898 family)
MTGMGDLIFGILTMLTFIGAASALLDWSEIFVVTILLIIITMLVFLVWSRFRTRDRI